jgi:hypothetical protein
MNTTGISTWTIPLHLLHQWPPRPATIHCSTICRRHYRLPIFRFLRRKPRVLFALFVMESMCWLQFTLSVMVTPRYLADVTAAGNCPRMEYSVTGVPLVGDGHLLHQWPPRPATIHCSTICRRHYRLPHYNIWGWCRTPPGRPWQTRTMERSPVHCVSNVANISRLSIYDCALGFILTFIEIRENFC